MEKTILYIGGFNLPDKNAAAQRVIANSLIFEQLGYNVVLVGLTHDRGDAGIWFKRGNMDCVNLAYPSNISEWWNYLTSAKSYKQLIADYTPSAVIAYNHPAVALKKLLKHNRALGIKTFADCTEWYEPKEGNALFRMIKKWDVEKRMYEVHFKMDGIITISRFLDDFYKEKGKETVLLPPLVDLQDTKWTEKKENNNLSKTRLIYAGSPTGNKDRLDWIVGSLNRILPELRKDNSVELLIIGITEQQYRHMYQVGNDEQLPAFVTFLGRIAHEDVIQQLLHSDFQIFLRERSLPNMAGFPTKFAESISSKTLVLTNDTSNLTDYLENGKNGFLLNIENEQKLSDSLRKALSLPIKEIRRLRDEMDNTVFDYRKYILQMERFLANVLNPQLHNSSND